MKFETPILFLFFNRIETTKKVFDQIRQIKPQYLFLAADGPREDRPGEEETCQHVRKMVLSCIDWDCKIETFFQEKNLGCGKAVSSAITWFFENVEQGIILEDDCLPDPSFFTFCDELLNKFKNCDRIISICGTNIVPNYSISSSYLFSLYGGNWGWASWQRAWKLYNYNMDDWSSLKSQNRVKKNLRDNSEFEGIKQMFDTMVSENKIDTWDIQWFYCRLLNDKLTIVPKKNLIRNIGFGDFATHTFDQANQLNNLTLNQLEFPLRHNDRIMSDRKFDQENSKIYGWYKKKHFFSFLKLNFFHK